MLEVPDVYRRKLVHVCTAHAESDINIITYVDEPDWSAGGLLPLRQSFNKRPRANRSGSTGCVDDDVMLAGRLLQKL